MRLCMLKRALHGVYSAAGIAAALSMLLILCLIVAQIVARQFDTHIPSSGDVMGYAVVWATFLGLPYTMQARGHIRVELVTSRLPRQYRRPLALLIGLFATVMLAVLSYFVIMLIYESWDYQDVTDGEIPLPLWLVQLPMAIGCVLFTLSMLTTTVEDWLAKPRPVDIS